MSRAVVTAVALMAACIVGERVAISEEKAPRRIAIVVGANEASPGRKRLRYAHNDAESVAKVLALAGFAADDVHVLRDPQPSALLSELDAALAEQAGGESVLFFYYSGHADAHALYPAGERLALADLRDRLDNLDATVRVGIIDACRGGGWTGTKGLAETDVFDVNLPMSLSNEGSVLISSSSGLEDAHESEVLRGSFFTHHWNAALRGAGDENQDGTVTLAEAFDYAKSLTIRDTAMHTETPQHPSFQMNLRGQRDLPLVTLTGASSVVALRQSVGPLQLVHLGTGAVLLEVPKGKRRLRLSVPPGRYVLRRQVGKKLHARVVEVSGGKTTRIDEEDLGLVGKSRLAVKGFSSKHDELGKIEPIKNFTEGKTNDVVEVFDGAPLHRRQTTAVRRRGEIAIDGEAEESAWQRIPETPGTWQQRPLPGAKMSGKWFFRVAYDDRSLYVFARVIDDPQRIRASLQSETLNKLERSEWLRLTVDPKSSRARGFVFMINPANSRVDGSQLSDEELDTSVDLVWESAAKVTDDGWQAEWRIPLSQMNVRGGEHSSWGFNMERMTAHGVEHQVWSPYSEQSGREVSGAGNILFHQDRIERPLNLELSPYVLAGTEWRPGVAADDEVNELTDFKGQIGGDFRFPVGDRLTVFGSINPNFGQVEADPAQVNLTAQELFFQERRSLFLRDLAQYDYKIGDGFERLFYTRRIGAPPKTRPFGAQYSDIPLTSTVLGATRVDAELGRSTTVGLLSSLTAQESAAAQQFDGEIRDEVVEPMTLYNIGHVTTNFSGGRTDLRLLATQVHRFLDGTDIDVLRRDAIAGALRLDHRFSSYRAGGSFSGSYVSGSAEAIALTQRGNVHNFIRPDADHLSFDPQRTSMAGTAFSAYVEKLGELSGRLSVDGISPSYEINDAGFLLYADRLRVQARGQYNHFPGSKSGALTSYRIGANASIYSDWSPELLGADIEGFGAIETRQNHSLLLRSGFEENRRDVRLLRGGPSIGGERRAWGRLELASDPKRLLAAGLDLRGGYRPSSGSTDAHVGAPLRWDILDNFDLWVTPAWSARNDATQYVTAAVDQMDEQHYVFGTIDLDQLSLTLRSNITFTPYLTLTAYAQPFIARGKYSSFREAVDFGTSSFGRRYNDLERVGESSVDVNGDGNADFEVFNPDFVSTNFNSTVVLRWQYRPGSYFHIIWNNRHGRFTPDPDLSSGFDRILTKDSEQTFLAKLSYWFGL